MRIGSLFSGIGGLDLGLEMSGVGHVVWQVEIDARCRKVLAKHWPGVEQHEDVRTVGAANLARVDLICGGFPCTDVSSAGKRAGLNGPSSGLWFEYLRIVQELRPQWVVVENVASGAAAWVDAVCRGLGASGYATLPVPIAAADVGAPHERSRVFIVAANTHAHAEYAGAEHAEVAGASVASDVMQIDPRRQQGRRGGTKGPLSPEPAHDREVAANADAVRRHERHWSGRDAAKQPGTTERGWRSPMPPMVRVADGISRGVDSPRKRIASLGNAVVPQCAEVIGHVIQQLVNV